MTRLLTVSKKKIIIIFKKYRKALSAISLVEIALWLQEKKVLATTFLQFIVL